MAAKQTTRTTQSMMPSSPPTPPISATMKYNPHLWGDDELRAIFVVRQRELQDILEILEKTRPDSVAQHILITGLRGMGKSTLLRRIALAVRESPELAAQWLPLSFPEEQYTVSSLAEFWQNVLDALADSLEQAACSSEELLILDNAIAAIEQLSPELREEAALGLLKETFTRHKRRILLLIDSTDLLFNSLSQESKGRGKKADAGAAPLWRLRKTLSHETGIFWLGASYQALESEHQYQDAFHDFFRLTELRPLRLEEMKEAMLALAQTFGMAGKPPGEEAHAVMLRMLTAKPERLRALRTMTGGNPRTTVILYDLFAAGAESNTHSDLNGLLDTMTPLYKARMESLAEQPRKILAHLMEQWSPVTARELADVADIPVTTVSGQLSRLETEGLVQPVQAPGRKTKSYQVAERFFNIWYLMRSASRRQRQRLLWLVEFMRLWYSTDELAHIAKYRAADHRCGGMCDESNLDYSRAVACALPDGHLDKYRLDWSVFTAARATKKVLQQLFDLEGSDHVFTTADDYLERFNRLDELLARCPHVDDVDAWILAVKGSASLSLDEKEKVALAAETLSKYQIDGLLKVFAEEQQEWKEKFGDAAAQTAQQAISAGNFFPECPDGELAYNQIFAAFSENPKALLFALSLLGRTNEHVWTEKAYRKAIQIHPTDSSLVNYFGVFLKSRTQRYAEAEEAYRTAIKLDPKAASPWTNLANLLKNHLERYGEAEDAYRTAIERDPKDATPWYNLGNLLKNHLERYGEAEDAYRTAIELDPKDAMPWHNLGNLLQVYLDRYGEAEEAYRTAIKLDPKNALPWNGLGYLLKNHLERYGEAEEAYRTAIKLDPNDATPWNILGNLLKNHLERYGEAEEAYRTAIELDPKSAAPWYGLGILLKYHLDRYGEAEEAYRTAIELDPKSAAPWYGLGNLLQDHLERYAEAEEAYRTAIELDPKSAAPWYGLGNLLQNHLERYGEAEDAYRTAIKLDPKDAAPWNSLGELLANHMGRFEEAENAYQEAIELDPGNSYHLANLARLFARQGKNEEATTYYRRAAAEAKEDEQNLILQAHLWLQNRDLAGGALEKLARSAAQGNSYSFFLLRQQAWECCQCGIGDALADLMEGSVYKDFLQPITLALRAAIAKDEKILDMAPVEVAQLASEVFADIQRRTQAGGVS